MEKKSLLSQEVLYDLNRSGINIFDMLRKRKLVVRQKAFML